MNDILSTGHGLPSRRKRRGFAGMDPERLREVARTGGKAAHAQGLAHEFSPQEARQAGLKSQRLRALRGLAEKAADLVSDRRTRAVRSR